MKPSLLDSPAVATWSKKSEAISLQCQLEAKEDLVYSAGDVKVMLL
jgi:hypothetical protein